MGGEEKRKKGKRRREEGEGERETAGKREQEKERESEKSVVTISVLTKLSRTMSHSPLYLRVSDCCTLEGVSVDIPSGRIKFSMRWYMLDDGEAEALQRLYIAHLVRYS